MRPALALILACWAGMASAQTIADEQAALDTARRQAQAAIERSKRYEAASRQAVDTAARARADAAAIAARIQESEAAIDAAQARIAIIEQLRAKHRRNLAERQQPIARLLAALQTMARRPGALTLVQPGAFDDMIHTRLLLSSMMPVVEKRTEALRAEIARGARLREAADAAVAALHRRQAELGTRRDALARLEAAELARSRQLGDAAFLEQERAQGIGEKARDITDLMRQMEAQALVSARLAALPGPLPRPVPRATGSTSAPARNTASPAPATAQAVPSRRVQPPDYRLPVIGRVVTGLGEINESGIRSRGLTLAPRPDAQIIAPADGHVRFAGPFRGYDGIVILDHGDGWTTLITGLGKVTARVGQKVVPGSPIGRAGRERPRITVELRHKGETIAIAPLAAGA